MADDDKDDRGWKKATRAAGKSLSKTGSDIMDRAASERISPVQYRKGGKVHKSRKKDRTKTRV